MKNPPLKDGDWTSLNARLDRIEKEFSKYVKPEVKKSQPEISSKTIGTSLNLDTTISSPIASPTSSQTTNPPKTPTYTNTEGNVIDENYNPPVISSSTIISGTPASMSIPNAYFRNISAHNHSTRIRHFTVDALTVHNDDVPVKTIGLANIDVINDVDTYGVDGRDDAKAFANCWIHFFVIYDPDSQLVKSLSSVSIKPYLPTHYTYYQKIGSAYVAGASTYDIMVDSQINDTIFFPAGLSGTVTVANTWEKWSIGMMVPKTAKIIFGNIGMSESAPDITGVGIASDSSGNNSVMTTCDSHTYVSGYNQIVDPVHFVIPLTNAGVVYVNCSRNTDTICVMSIGYVDDLLGGQIDIRVKEKFMAKESKTI